MLTSLYLYPEIEEDEDDGASHQVADRLFSPAYDRIAYPLYDGIEENFETLVWELIWEHVRAVIDQELEDRF